jgi:argininosuccinate lyase
MWKGRFQKQTARSLRDFSESISFDWRLYRHDIEGSIAHAYALEAAGILAPEERAAIEGGLMEIRSEIEAGTFPFSADLEDIHMNIEAELTRRIGPAGGKLHTARSRNDQVALDLRLYLRDETGAILREARSLQEALVGLAEAHPGAILPGYTHLQRAQPVLFAHHLLAYVEMIERDRERFADALKRIDIMPLGSGAIAGSTIPLDREGIARRLGFSRVSRNSMDAVGDRDFACEFLAAAAIAGMHLSRLGEDLILWASSEFGFAEPGDDFSTGSSLMPQKKNPDPAELTRGKAGRLFGNLIALLTVLKGLPLTYNRDLQEDKEPVFDSADTLRACFSVMAGMIAGLGVREDRMREAASDPMLLATDLADYLVRKGMPFRNAHEAVGKAVARCRELGVDLPSLPLGEYRAISEVYGEDLFALFDPRRSLASRTTTGSPSPDNVAREIAGWRTRFASGETGERGESDPGPNPALHGEKH